MPETYRLAGWRSSQSPDRRRGRWWTLLWTGIPALAACVPAAAWAQGSDANNAGAALKSACRTDYRRHCVGNDPAAPIAAACLAQYYTNLSKNCQAALDAYNAPPADTGQE